MITKPEKIRNIIFDFGDIFIDLDKPATLKELQRFGYDQPTEEMSQLAMAYEKGTVSTAFFAQELQRMIPKAQPSQIQDAWNAILKDIPAYRLEFLRKLKTNEQFELFLLSNTNEWHIDFVKEAMGKVAYAEFKGFFKGFYLSYEMGMRKPDAEIYEQVLTEQALRSEETLFIDDTKENTDSAGLLGIQTWHLQVGQQDIIDLPKQLDHA